MPVPIPANFDNKDDMLNIDFTGFWEYHRERIARVFRGVTDLPQKVDPDEFGGGRVVGIVLAGEETDFMCSRSGCSRKAHATWGGCADNNIYRPLCPECDVLLNYLTLLWWGDPQAQEKIREYAEGVEADIGRELGEDAWDITALMERVAEYTE